ncbi:hypothetical protein [Natrarchaeobius oligotrophus]|uniref:Uncharacterized protein n=1 Tax=Natrarchaeobius chitinivorans TaxID=1679083 RepID=A0A3N6N387_NATCH|nr:hypothetical protein [Natrarchaeobius chitinivorans]RQH03372.1 hypothetical protein EA472_02045 [Natrarchaeobius chitinivorans]
MTHLPESLADSWRVSGRQSGETSVLLATISAETTLYEPTDPAIEASGQNEFPPRSLFIVDLTFSPSLSSVGVSPAAFRSRAADEAGTQFVDLLENRGASVAGKRDELEFEGPNGAAGRWRIYDVTFPIGRYGRDGGGAVPSAGETDDPSAADSSERIAGNRGGSADDGDRIRAEAHVAVWPTDHTYGVAGGTLPLEEPIREATEATLAIDPERDRETISEFVGNVEIGGGDGPDDD